VETWTSAGPADDISTIAIAPNNQQIIYAVGKTGLWKTTNGGISWANVASLPMGEYGPLVVDPTNPSILYASGSRPSGGIVKSTNGGVSWTTVRAGGYATAIAIDPTRPGWVYAGVLTNGTAQLFKTTDGGVTWNAISNSVMVSPGIPSVQSLAIEPGRSDTVYAAWVYYHAGAVLRSDDAAATWVSTSAGTMASLMYPTALAVGQRTGTTTRAYSAWVVTGAGKLLASTDAGNSWSDVTGGLPAGTYAPGSLVVPGDDATVIAAMGSARVQISSDGGLSWTPLGPAPVNIGQLAYAPTTRTLYGGSSTGVWQYTFGTVSSSTAIASRFQQFYNTYDGLRLLGMPISVPTTTGKYFSQYFEKGRLEDHTGESADPNWQFMYGLLVDELQIASSGIPIGGDVSTITYTTLKNEATAAKRVAAPAGFTGGAMIKPDGSAFVPFTADLSPAAGHNIAPQFWTYINNPELFPGGWLHDVGLPITESLGATVDKGANKGRTIAIQAFQRTILTYDPANPPNWQVERANVGTDFAKAFPGNVPK
jgi:photosystem II stability/assembly factor-like uncharacterized protein